MVERMLPPHASGQIQRLVAQRKRLKTILASLTESITEAEAVAAATASPAPDSSAATASAAPEASSIEVVIGTSAMAKADPTLIGRITQMINSAYFEGNKELLPPTATTYTRVDEDDVENRLEMGDAGARANRVLHLAFRGGVLVGAMSSTFQPGWTPAGCGHWGLLVVDPSAQGSGVCYALVAAAERRLAGACQMVQIEYEYTRGHTHSEKLMSLYESKMGFQCSLPMPRRRRRGGNNDLDDGEEPPETQFRKCHKMLPDELCARQRPHHLKALKADFEEQLAAEAAERQPGGVDRIGKQFKLGGEGLGALSHLRGCSITVLLFQPADDEGDEEDADDEKVNSASYIALVQRRSDGKSDGAKEGEDEDEDEDVDEEDDPDGTLIQVSAKFLLAEDEEDEQDVEDVEDDAVKEKPATLGTSDGSSCTSGGASDEPSDAARAELVVGGVVRAVGLTNRADLNGQRGVIISHDTSTGRYGVSFDGGASALLKAENLDPGPLGAEPSEVQ